MAGGKPERDARGSGRVGQGAGNGEVEGGEVGGCGVVLVAGTGFPRETGGVGIGCFGAGWAFAAGGWRRIAGGAEEQGVGPGVSHDDAGDGDGEQGQAEPEAGEVVEIPLTGAAVQAGAEEHGGAKVLPGKAAGEPEIEAAEDDGDEEERGSVLEGAERLVADAAEGDLVVELLDGLEEDAKAAGAGAEDAAGAGIGEQDGAVAAGGDLSGTMRVGEDGEAGEGLRGGGGGVVEEGGRGDAGGGGGGVVDVALGGGDELRREGYDGAGQGEAGNDKADGDTGGEVRPEEKSAEGQGRLFGGEVGAGDRSR